MKDCQSVKLRPSRTLKVVKNFLSLPTYSKPDYKIPSRNRKQSPLISKILGVWQPWRYNLGY